MRTRLTFVLAALCLILMIDAHAFTPLQSSQHGVFVEEVTNDGAAAKAGIQPGDIILGWSRAAGQPANPEAAQGAINFPFDLTEVEVEQPPRGTVALNGTRESRNISFVLAPGAWRIRVRPEMPEQVL